MAFISGDSSSSFAPDFWAFKLNSASSALILASKSCSWINRCSSSVRRLFFPSSSRPYAADNSSTCFSISNCQELRNSGSASSKALGTSALELTCSTKEIVARATSAGTIQRAEILGNIVIKPPTFESAQGHQRTFTGFDEVRTAGFLFAEVRNYIRPEGKGNCKRPFRYGNRLPSFVRTLASEPRPQGRVRQRCHARRP